MSTANCPAWRVTVSVDGILSGTAPAGSSAVVKSPFTGKVKDPHGSIATREPKLPANGVHLRIDPSLLQLGRPVGNERSGPSQAAAPAFYPTAAN